MTTLVAEELKTTINQTISFNHYRRYHISGIKIKLLMYNAPSGTFTLSIKNGATTLASADFTSADIKTDLDTTDNYAYLYKALDFSLPLNSGSYEFELSASGYTPTSSSFLAWCKSYENVFNEQINPNSNDFDKPFDILIYEKVREDLQR